MLALSLSLERWTSLGLWESVNSKHRKIKKRKFWIFLYCISIVSHWLWLWHFWHFYPYLQLIQIFRVVRNNFDINSWPCLIFFKFKVYQSFMVKLLLNAQILCEIFALISSLITHFAIIVFRSSHHILGEYFTKEEGGGHRYILFKVTSFFS